MFVFFFELLLSSLHTELYAVVVCFSLCSADFSPAIIFLFVFLDTLALGEIHTVHSFPLMVSNFSVVAVGGFFFYFYFILLFVSLFISGIAAADRESINYCKPNFIADRKRSVIIIWTNMDLVIKNDGNALNFFPNYQQIGAIASNFIQDNINYVKLNPVESYQNRHIAAAAAAAAAATANNVIPQMPNNAMIHQQPPNIGHIGGMIGGGGSGGGGGGGPGTTTNVITVAQQHKCDICQKTFVDDNRLMIHMKRHSDKKPTSFECTICFKTFSQQGNLKTHYRIHTNEKVIHSHTHTDTHRY